VDRTPVDGSTSAPDWEAVVERWTPSGSLDKTQRLRVPGGWLYRVRWVGHGSLCFVPDAAQPGK
jgi:hypothetical protein